MDTSEVDQIMITLFDSDIDFSFAICPRRRLCYNAYDDGGDDDDDCTISTDDDDDETSSVDSGASASTCRSVTFALNIVSEVISVPRYESNSKSTLFYTKLDMRRFKQEAKLERIHQIHVLW